MAANRAGCLAELNYFNLCRAARAAFQPFQCASRSGRGGHSRWRAVPLRQPVAAACQLPGSQRVGDVARFAVQDGLFRRAKRGVSGCKTGRIAAQNENARLCICCKGGRCLCRASSATLAVAEREELEPFIKQIEIIICKCNTSALQMLDYIYFM